MVSFFSLKDADAARGEAGPDAAVHANANAVHANEMQMSRPSPK